MGYNRRALNLWRAARVVVEEHGGELPRDVAALERLPGIGPYTARAVAAIAFGLPVGAVDTNVRRVLGRALGGIARRACRRSELQRVADASVPRDRPADWTHALMDVGATFCRPTAPRCGDCPARAWCRYAATAGPADAVPARGTARRAAAEPPLPSRRRRRWLRGRILDRLREATAPAGSRSTHRIGDHDAPRSTRRCGARDARPRRADPGTALRRARLPIAERRRGGVGLSGDTLARHEPSRAVRRVRLARRAAAARRRPDAVRARPARAPRALGADGRRGRR